MRVGLISRTPSDTTIALAAAPVPGATLVAMAPDEAVAELGPGDAAVGRLDVLSTLDGVDDGLRELNTLAAKGVTVLNGPGALLAAHDKLLTARLLGRAQLPHPRTALVSGPGPHVLGVAVPVVVKPRFGSWGRDVTRCSDEHELSSELERVSELSWYASHGAIVQELVPPLGYDLRVIVVCGEVIGAVHRVAAAGEWRTNVALGATRVPAVAPPEAAAISKVAAAAAGASLVGVDLLPLPGGGWAVIELNGAVEFTAEYGDDVFEAAASALVREARDLLGAGGEQARRPPAGRLRKPPSVPCYTSAPARRRSSVG